MTEPLLFIFSGPREVGKKTLIRRLQRDYPNDFCYVPIHTSALPDTRTSTGFYFVHHTRDEMKRVIADDEFLTYWTYDGELYGVNKRLLTSYMEICRVRVVWVLVDVVVAGVIFLSCDLLCLSKFCPVAVLFLSGFCIFLPVSDLCLSKKIFISLKIIRSHLSLSGVAQTNVDKKVV